MSENKHITISVLQKVLEPIVELINNKADKTGSSYPETGLEDKDDAMEMLVDMGVIDPVTDEEDNIFVDENGDIFIV